MKVSKFNEREAAALRALGFKVNDEFDEATTSGQTTIVAIHPAESKFFSLSITLPGDAVLGAQCPHQLLIEASGVDEDTDDGEAAS